MTYLQQGGSHHSIFHDYGGHSGRKCSFPKEIKRVCCSSLFSCLPKKRHFKNLSKKQKTCLTRKIGMTYKQTQTKKATSCFPEKESLLNKKSRVKENLTSSHVDPIDIPVFPNPGFFDNNEPKTAPKIVKGSILSFRVVYFWSRRFFFGGLTCFFYRKNGTTLYRFRKKQPFLQKQLTI